MNAIGTVERICLTPICLQRTISKRLGISNKYTLTMPKVLKPETVVAYQTESSIDSINHAGQHL